MILSEYLKKIKYIQIRTRRILSGILIGDRTTAIKGTGLEFDQIREYQQGDDVRFVDWKNSAKMGQLLVKQYFEERNRNIVIALDVSSSSFFSSSQSNKYDIMAQVACILMCACEYSKDNISLLLFSDKVNEFIPYKNGNYNIACCMKKIFNQGTEGKKTNINSALDYLNNNIKKDSIVFIISDFIDDNDFTKNLKILAKKNTLVSIRCLDQFEQNLPEMGIICVNDFETGQDILIDIRSKKRNKVNLEINKLISLQNKFFKQCGIKYLDINSNKDYFSDLICFFRKFVV